MKTEQLAYSKSLLEKTKIVFKVNNFTGAVILYAGKVRYRRIKICDKISFWA